MGKSFLRWGRFTPLVVMSEMVRTEVAVPAPGVMVAGENEQLSVSGILPQLSEMGLLKVPDCSLAVTVKAPDIPEGIVIVAGDALKLRVIGSGVGAGVGSASLQLGR